MKLPLRTLATLGLVTLTASADAQTKVWIDRNEHDKSFRFEKVPAPATNDAAREAEITLIAGERDGSGAEFAALIDGKMPTSADQPASNFFLAGSHGGRLAIDLGRVITVGRVGTYSWHAEGRGPQAYKLYGADGSAVGFDPKPAEGVDPTTVGWKFVADVNTLPQSGGPGGQYGVSVAGSSRAGIGRFRYLLFDIVKGVPDDPFGNTFFSEIDVVDVDGPELVATEAPEKVMKEFQSPDRKYTFTVDATLAPDLMPWTEKELMPVVFEWYPKIAKMLPSSGYREADKILMEYRNDMEGTPAYAAGTRVALNVEFFRGQMQNEARGAVVHELVHVVQDYWRGRRGNREAKPTPSWVTEGIADYIRWFLYEPQSKGAEITERNFEKANYDSSYRVTGNFLNWVIAKHDKDIVRKLNEAAREARYSEDFWKQRTGKTVEELGAAWKAENAKRLNIKPDAEAS